MVFGKKAESLPPGVPSFQKPKGKGKIIGGIIMLLIGVVMFQFLIPQIAISPTDYKDEYLEASEGTTWLVHGKITYVTEITDGSATFYVYSFEEDAEADFTSSEDLGDDGTEVVVELKKTSNLLLQAEMSRNIPALLFKAGGGLFMLIGIILLAVGAMQVSKTNGAQKPSDIPSKHNVNISHLIGGPAPAGVPSPGGPRQGPPMPGGPPGGVPGMSHGMNQSKPPGGPLSQPPGMEGNMPPGGPLNQPPGMGGNMPPGGQLNQPPGMGGNMPPGGPLNQPPGMGGNMLPGGPLNQPPGMRGNIPPGGQLNQPPGMPSPISLGGTPHFPTPSSPNSPTKEKGGIQELPGMDHNELPLPEAEMPKVPPSGSPVDPLKGLSHGNPPGLGIPGPAAMGRPSQQPYPSQPARTPPGTLPGISSGTSPGMGGEPQHTPPGQVTPGNNPPSPPGQQLFPGPSGTGSIPGKPPAQQPMTQGPVTPQFQPQSWTCQNCQTSVDSKFAFCMSCGHKRHG